MLLSDLRLPCCKRVLKTLATWAMSQTQHFAKTTSIAPNLNVSSSQQSGLCRDTPEAVPEERENLPDSGARFCSSRLARPSTWVFHIVELGVPHVGALPTGNKTIKDQVLTCKASERQARTDKLWQKISCKTSVHTHTHTHTRTHAHLCLC